MSVISIDTLPEKLPVVSADGAELLFWADAELAQQLIDRGVVEILRTKRKIRRLRVLDPAIVKDFLEDDQDGPKAGTHYSHNRETKQNPQNVWVLKGIDLEFRCQKRAA